MATHELPGIARPAVDEWLAANVAGLELPVDYRLIAGGRSNLTFAVRDAGGRRFVLRRPPTGHVLPSAHDVVREHKIISALAPTTVPVAPVAGLCEDSEVTGGPFYVMEFVDGVVLATKPDAEQHTDAALRPVIAENLIDTLVELHAIDPVAVGLGDLGRHDGYAERQLRRWQRQFEAAKTHDVPVIDEVHRRLAASIPQQQRVSIVHGDYRLGNCLVGPEGGIAAVLDWELCTLGDPLADLGLLMVYWSAIGEDGGRLGDAAPTALPGFPDRATIAARYAERSGTDIARLDFYVALAYWKLACIYAGIVARYAAGVMADDGFDAPAYDVELVTLAERALSYTTELTT